MGLLIVNHFISVIIFSFLFTSSAWAETYHLEIAQKKISVNGVSAEKFTVNGTIPAPTLTFREGEQALIEVANHLDEDTSIHWHGLLLPGEMDGVPGFNGFPGIKPGETFTYSFKLRQSGTYWYHAHSLGQEQDGLYGAIIVSPREKDRIEYDREYVLLLSEYSKENAVQILGNLKMNSAYYNHAQRTIFDFFQDVKEVGLNAALQEALDWGEMRMSRTDLSDVSGYTFLINGKSAEENWTGLFKKGERVRLRFINASAMSIFDVRIPGLKLTVVQADGQNVEPLIVDEFRFGVAETYDLVVTPQTEEVFTIVAEPIDRTGFALGTLASKGGMLGPMPQHRKRALLTMADMGGMHDMSTMDHSKHSMHDMESMQSGWADADTPAGMKALSYSDLRSLEVQKYTAAPEREIVLHLDGNMERFIWTLNGKKFEESEPIRLRYGERIKITYVNDSMMAHPMHLHGMFVQIDNGQPPEKRPNKHTVIIPPGTSYSVFLTADEPGEWAFHCHLLYHMLSGMMTQVVVERPNAH